MTVETLGTIGAVFVASLVWLIRLEGRVNAHDLEHNSHKERNEELRAGQTRQYDDLRADLAYIRARIDAVLGAR